MFTGIIEEVGKVVDVQRQKGNVRLRIEATVSASELSIGDSVSLNGVCQTVVSRQGSGFEVVVVEETLMKTTLGSWISGSKVNIELPVRLNARLGGHVVLGHVDAVGEIMTIDEREGSCRLRISVPDQFSKYLVPVGCIAIDGVSLTLAGVEDSTAIVSIIPHTLENTIFSEYRKSSKVNIEFDILGKYIERLMIGRNDLSRSKTFPDDIRLTAMGY